MRGIISFPALLTLLFPAVLCASGLNADQHARLPSRRRSVRQIDDGIIPDEFLMQITAACDDACREEAQILLSASNKTVGCAIGSAGVKIGSIHLEMFFCEIEELYQLPPYLLESFAKELVSTVSTALAASGARPMMIVNSVTVSTPVFPPVVIDPEASADPDCVLNSSRGVPFRGGLLFPHEQRPLSPVECGLFGIDETDGGFPTDGLRTCAPLSMNGRDVSVWILDTGCEPSPGGMCADSSGGELVPMECADIADHGTAVSEIATGPTGVAVQSTRHCLRVLTGTAAGSWIPVIMGLGVVSENLDLSPKGNVVNLSIMGGVDVPFAALLEMILDELTSLGVFIAGAVGNLGVNACLTLPSAFRGENFFSVQAHGIDSVPFEDNNFSELGADCVDISAPGVGIIASMGLLVSATSFATPHVSGAMAVLLSDDREVSMRMLANVTRLIDNGPGRLDELSLGLSCPEVVRRAGK